MDQMLLCTVYLHYTLQSSQEFVKVVIVILLTLSHLFREQACL